MYRFSSFSKWFFVLLLFICVPFATVAEQLKILQGSIPNAVSIAPGNSIIVENDNSITEILMANPAIADMSFESEFTVKVSGVNEGRTTLTLLDEQGTVSHIEVSIAANARATSSRVTVPDMPRPRTTSVSFTGTSNATVYRNGAIAIETDEPFSNILIDDPSIADGSTFSNNSVYILGKQLGTTILTLKRADSDETTEITIRVTEYPNR